MSLAQSELVGNVDENARRDNPAPGTDEMVFKGKGQPRVCGLPLLIK